MALNLVQHRGESNVWDGIGARLEWDGERWLLGAVAASLLAYGLRRRTPVGLMLAIGGGCVAWWAAAGPNERQAHRGRIRAVWPASEGDAVHEAAEESFPASDAPSWTPTTGNTGPSPRHTH